MIRQNQKYVSIIYRFLPQYRLEFYNELKTKLLEENIILNLYYGKNKYVVRKDEIDIKWATPINNQTFNILNEKFYWLHFKKEIFNSNLIILVQENRILSNYAIMLISLLKGIKIALWGHGRNHQSTTNSLGNNFKRLYSNKIHWWFSYTQNTANIIQNMGFPKDRITIINNAIDTNFLIQEGTKFNDKTINEFKRKLNILKGPIGVFCGGIYKEKRIDFLYEACTIIKNHFPEFNVIFIGAGPESHKVAKFSCENNWIHYFGPKFGKEKVPYLKSADVLLNPGAVGLSILDAFALEVPFVTTKYPYHGPEIEYLINYKNGIITDNDVESYAKGVIKVLSSKKLIMVLKHGCRNARTKYTKENMVSKFSIGIKKALQTN